MPITPDTKNWTWVIARRCPECGFDASTLDVVTLPALIRRNASVWTTVLAGAGVANRPDDSTWSHLEYAAHVRDVLRVYRARVALMMTEDDPLYQNWDQDATAVDDNYGAQNPAVVAEELTVAAEALAADFARLRGDDWNRPGRRSDGAQFTIATLGAYFAHDIEHHLVDVGRELVQSTS
ncbi:DinB family protein [Glaciihabitans sp. dw_435]|uniref:DinB family protein n=1 Tax=Glaciihabitans sp. dw_435 TaxID=2720081 RepID=UPI001BD6D52B|nr:DinB family protein [Glaciihabitans sp. dw_435]